MAIYHPLAKNSKAWGTELYCIGLFDALDEALREVELGAELAFAAGHLAGVGFVIVAAEMKQAVKNQHLQFAG